MEPIRLTQTVSKGGCAAKLPAGQLKEVLAKLTLQKPAALHVGTETMDDACLWDLGNGDYLIQTVDFFTPIVDDAFDFGAIAAANALSDVYAMGGAPRIALSVLAFPSADLPLSLLEPLLGGALSKIHEAGATLAGGHTIDDTSLKLGFCVSGFVNQKLAWKNRGAKAGDALILTKALGTGTITSGIKSGKANSDAVAAAVASMKQLNTAPDLLRGVAVHAATDITGFGLAGHLLQLLRASGVSCRLDMAQLPALLGARDSLNAGITNRAHRTNGEYVSEAVNWGGISEVDKLLLLDPQTSGGLLLSVPANFADEALHSLLRQFPVAQRVGTVVSESEIAGGKRLAIG